MHPNLLHFDGHDAVLPQQYLARTHGDGCPPVNLLHVPSGPLHYSPAFPPLPAAPLVSGAPPSMMIGSGRPADAVPLSLPPTHGSPSDGPLNMPLHLSSLGTPTPMLHGTDAGLPPSGPGMDALCQHPHMHVGVLPGFQSVLSTQARQFGGSAPAVLVPQLPGSVLPVGGGHHATDVCLTKRVSGPMHLDSYGRGRPAAADVGLPLQAADGGDGCGGGSATASAHPWQAPQDDRFDGHGHCNGNTLQLWSTPRHPAQAVPANGGRASEERRNYKEARSAGKAGPHGTMQPQKRRGPEAEYTDTSWGPELIAQEVPQEQATVTRCATRDALCPSSSRSQQPTRHAHRELHSAHSVTAAQVSTRHCRRGSCVPDAVRATAG